MSRGLQANCCSMRAQSPTWQFQEDPVVQAISEVPSSLPYHYFSDGCSESISSIVSTDDIPHYYGPRGVNSLKDQRPGSTTSLINNGKIAESVYPSEILALPDELEYEYSGHERAQNTDDITLWIDSLELNPAGFRKACVLTAGCIVQNPQMHVLKPSAKFVNQPASPCDEHPDKSQRQKGKNSKGAKKLLPNRKRSLTLDEDSECSKAEADTVLRTNIIGFACPFTKHNPERYEYVKNSCTERFGFPTPGKLV